MRTHLTCAKDLLRYLIGIKGRKMMTIAYITINSGLVPLIEGLCAQILYFRFEIIGACVHISCFSFPEEKIC